MSDVTFPPGDYKTRAGYKARVRFVLSQPSDSDYVLIGELQNDDGSWGQADWKPDGSFTGIPSGCDLQPPRQYRWAALLPNGIGSFVCGGRASAVLPAILPEQEVIGTICVEVNADGKFNWHNASLEFEIE